MVITWNGGCGSGGGGAYVAGEGISITGGVIAAEMNSNNTYSKSQVTGMIAQTEVSPAETPRAIGEIITFNNATWRVASAIAVGDTLTPYVNITPTSVGQEIYSLSTYKYVGSTTGLNPISIPEEWNELLFIVYHPWNTSFHSAFILSKVEAERSPVTVNRREGVYASVNDYATIGVNFAPTAKTATISEAMRLGADHTARATGDLYYR